MKTLPRIEYDPDVDAAYIYLRDAPWQYMAVVDDYRNVDYGEDGQPIGVELLYVSKGVRLDGLPERETIARLLREERLAVPA